MARNKAERQSALKENEVQNTEEVNDTAPVATEKSTKSIVPAKYAGKYKNGGSDPVADFIKSQCGEGEKFAFDSFWALCQKNGISEEQTNKYAGQIAEARQGAKGRARMTLGNTLRANARKNGKLIALDGSEVPLVVAKATLSGAAAAAKEASTQTSAADGVSTEDGASEAVEDTTSSSD
jgi:hypothetical protein